MPEDPDILVDLTTARTEFEAQTIANALEGHGIEAKVFANVGSTLQWEVAASQPIRVAVRRRDLDVARSVLRAVKAESIDVDWDEVDTGDEKSLREAEVRVMMEDRCPKCGYNLAGLDPNRSCPECGVNQRERAQRKVRAATPPTPKRAFEGARGRRNITWLGVALAVIAIMGLSLGWWKSLLWMVAGNSWGRPPNETTNPIGYPPDPR